MLGHAPELCRLSPSCLPWRLFPTSVTPVRAAGSLRMHLHFPSSLFLPGSFLLSLPPPQIPCVSRKDKRGNLARAGAPPARLPHGVPSLFGPPLPAAAHPALLALPGAHLGVALAGGLSAQDPWSMSKALPKYLSGVPHFQTQFAPTQRELLIYRKWRCCVERDLVFHRSSGSAGASQHGAVCCHWGVTPCAA